jgi:hypothetical protein
MAEKPAQNFGEQWAKIAAKALADDKFKQSLLADPAAALKAHGITPPAGVQLRVVQNTPTQVYLVLPSGAAGQELTEEQLLGVAGGMPPRFIKFDEPEFIKAAPKKF